MQCTEKNPNPPNCTFMTGLERRAITQNTDRSLRLCNASASGRNPHTSALLETTQRRFQSQCEVYIDRAGDQTISAPAQHAPDTRLTRAPRHFAISNERTNDVARPPRPRPQPRQNGPSAHHFVYHLTLRRIYPLIIRIHHPHAD